MKYQYSRDLDREIAILNWENREFKVPRLLNQRYEVIDLLSVGGMGVIFIAQDTKLFNKKVLVKRCLYAQSLFKHKNDISREGEVVQIRESMVTEYTAMIHGWARSIPNIPIPLDKFDDLNPEIYGPHKDEQGNSFIGEKELYETEPYVVINYFSGTAVNANHPEIAKNIVGFCEFYLRRVANILKRFHEPYITEVGKISFYYCDLKPGNVMLTKDKQIVLIDMGSFSIVVDGEAQNELVTTPGYCAPELITGSKHNVSPAVDVYSLAITVFELLTGEKPLADQYGYVELDWQKFEKIVNEANASYWIAIFKKALASLPENRYQTLDEFTESFNLSHIKKRSYNQRQHKKLNRNNVESLSENWMLRKWELKRIENEGYPIMNFPIWREEKFFHLSSSATAINKKHRLSTLHLNLLEDLFDKSVNNLIQNKTYLPELLEKTGNDSYINYVPSFLFPSQKDYILKSNLEKLVYLFLNFSASSDFLIGLSLQTIRFDLLGNPFINEFWLLLDKSHKHLLDNPETQKVIGNDVILPPELREHRRWEKEKSFVYLLGAYLLLATSPEQVVKLYRANKLIKKIEYEKLVVSLAIPHELKELLLLLINPHPGNRPTLDETLSKLKERKNTVVKRDKVPLECLGIRIESTNKLRNYRIEYREIGNKSDRLIKYKNTAHYKILYQKPTKRYAQILATMNCKPIVSSWGSSSEVETLLQEAIANKQTKLAILIFDETINAMKHKLSDLLAEFSKVLLFSLNNPFTLKNLDFYSLETYMIKKERRNGN